MFHELDENLVELTNAVIETGKKGTLTLKLTLGPLDGSTEQLLMNDEIKLAKPRAQRKPTVLFPTKSGDLTRNDPNQLEFQLMDLDDSKTEK
jgi:hypothetical protein